MNVAEYIINELIMAGTSHAFGIPGGVILKLLEAMEKAKPLFTPHLCYHEQDAGFAALGYAHAGNRIGAAYATRGPGIANMVTCMAEAYQESLPVLFMTAHGKLTEGYARSDNDQELDIVTAVSGFTKFSSSVQSPDEAVILVKKALSIAMDGRRGPVVLDFSVSVLGMEVTFVPNKYLLRRYTADCSQAVERTQELLSSALRPVILIGDGMRYCIPRLRFRELIDKLGIPVLSSRGAQDILSNSQCYFGYVGSHGLRYSNFILSKADLIVAVGNRMAFPLNSVSFSSAISDKFIIRIDVDEDELKRHIPGEISFECSGGDFMEQLCQKYSQVQSYSNWFDICSNMKNELVDEDCTKTVLQLSTLIECLSEEEYYVCDVGNNEFQFSRAYERSSGSGSIYCSKAFGTLGSAMGRAIGVYYASGNGVVCICGDQGFQYNIQELQFISQWGLPIKIIIVNNNSSGMIRDHEKSINNEMLIHVDKASGYAAPDIKKIAACYGICYTTDPKEFAEINTCVIYELKADEQETLIPFLPKGNLCQDMYPYLDRAKYEYFNNL